MRFNKDIFKRSAINMRRMFLAGMLASATAVSAQQSPKLPATENDFYQMATLPIPEGIVLEIGGMVVMPNGTLAVATRRGEVWMIENPTGEGNRQPYYKKFASGLHEILGLAQKDGELIMAQRGELTKLIDKNKDGKADTYETIYAWPLSAHYHEYSYGPLVMPDGSMMVTGNVAFGDAEWWAGESRVPGRGWAMRITPDGKMEPWAAGMRSPAGLGLVDGEFFYAENQGDWIGSGYIAHAKKGSFFGHPASLDWAGESNSPVKVKKEDLYKIVDPKLNPPGGPYVKPENLEGRGTALYEVAEKVPGVSVPAVWLPHGILGISNSEIINIPKDGRFGPFGGQLLVGDQGQSKISRIFLEKVKGEYQGGAVLFREGFQSGVLRMAWANDGSLLVGQTNRGWGSTGPDDYGLQKITFTGDTPFEIKTVSARPDGFEIEFTQPVDKAKAEDVNSYDITGFVYKYHPVYGSPVVDDKNCPISGIKVSDDRTKVRLLVSGLREKYIHEIKLSGITNGSNASLLHSTAYYTLNAIPDGAKISGHKKVTPKEPQADHSAHNHAAHTAAAASSENMAKRTATQPASWTNGPDQTILMGTRPGLKFDQTEITVKAGSRIKLILNNVDDMPHNLLIVEEGTSEQVGQAALNLGLKGNELGYIPDMKSVLYHTKLIQPGASDEIYFVAPTTPGKYTYVCTYPGHYLTMKGTLIVAP